MTLQGLQFRLKKYLWYGVALLAFPLRGVLTLLGIKIFEIKFNQIGHLALDPAYYLKLYSSSKRPYSRIIVLVPDVQGVNPHLLEYWKPCVSRIIFRSLWFYLLRPLAIDFTYNPNGRRYAEVERKSLQEKPLLFITEMDKTEGWKVLENFGISKGEWFVCIHNRESDSLPEYAGRMSYRDCDINSFLPAARGIVQRGGWVIRMGDKAMKPIPSMEKVIDYAASEYKSGWMDVFLCAHCKFFLGCTSGLKNVSLVFGVPFASTNLVPIGAYPLSFQEVGIPKLYWSTQEKRVLPFKEAFDLPLHRVYQMSDYTARGISFIDNDPEDIRDLAMEMMDRVDGQMVYSEEDEELQNFYRSLMRRENCGYGGNGRIGRNFLRKYKHLLVGDEESARFVPDSKRESLIWA